MKHKFACIEKDIEQPIISFPYGEEFSNVVYRVHKYWGRKPANVVGQYITTYCPEGGIILDPFLGGGTTAIEAIKLKRKIIGLDINPLAIFITKTTLSPVRLAPLESTFKSIFRQLIPIIAPLYQTRCIDHKCKKQAYISYIVFKDNDWNYLENESPQKIYYYCSCSSKTLQKEPDNEDLDRIKQIKFINISDWYPKDLNLPQIRPGRREARTIYDLFTKRNLYSLSIIYKLISEISPGIIRNCLLMAFSSALPQCSRLAGIERRNEDYLAMGWILTSFRIMQEHIERNPLMSFKFAFERILKGKQESNRLLYSYKEAECIEDIFKTDANGLIFQASVDDIQEIFKGYKVDYVFTDPPHGHSIQYMKLSTISNAWLKLPTSSEKEIIQETPSIRSREEFEKQIIRAFTNIRNVISSNCRVHVYFRGKKENEMLNAASLLVKSGFKFIRALFQPQRYSFRTTFRGNEGHKKHISAPGDWIMHLRPEWEKTNFVLRDDEIERVVVDKAKEILIGRGQPTELQYILLYVASEIDSNILGKDPHSIQRSLERNVNKIFCIEKNLKKKREDRLWWLIGHKKPKISLETEVERIVAEKLVGRDEIGASGPYLYQAIYSKFPSLKTPDQDTIGRVLDKVADLRGLEKKYYLKQEYMSKKEYHSRLVLALMRLGIANRFMVCISPSAIKRINNSELKGELADIWDKNPDDILPSDKFLENTPLEKYPNVLWVISERVHAHFEVEDSSEIPATTYEKGEIIREKYPESERVLVVPHKVIDGINMQLKEKQSFWHVAPYHNILFSDDPSTYKPIAEEEKTSLAGAEPLKLRIVSKIEIKDTAGEIVAFKLKLKCSPDVLKRIRPGHFLQVEINGNARKYVSKYHCGNDYYGLSGGLNGNGQKLEFGRVPLSIHRVYYENFEPTSFKNRSTNFLPEVFWEWIQRGEMNYLDLLIRIVGPGTRNLFQMREGEIINAVGPLGKSIEISSGIGNGILVSGGVGLASLYPIAHYLRERGYPVTLFAGAKDKRTLSELPGGVLHEFVEMGVKCFVTDETIEKRLVTDLFSEKIEYFSKHGGQIFSCGPWAMLKEVNRLAEQVDIPCTVLIDRLMLCGIGACMSCVVKTREAGRKGESLINLSRACLEGPAFNGKTIVWD